MIAKEQCLSPWRFQVSDSVESSVRHIITLHVTYRAACTMSYSLQHVNDSLTEWYLAIQACSLTEWYLERAGVRGGGGALFTAHDIRAAGTDCTQA